MAKAKKKGSAASRPLSMQAQQMNNVPPQMVGQIVQQFVLAHARQITCFQQGDGKWTITAL